MRIFNINIMSDKTLQEKLEQARSNQFENIKKFLHLTKIYQITQKCTMLPKCNACDENRQVTITLPDKSTTQINCSCKKYKTSYEVEESPLKIITVDIKSRITVNSYSDVFYHKLLTTKNDVDMFFNIYYFKWYRFSSKTVAKYALNKIKRNNNGN